MAAVMLDSGAGTFVLLKVVGLIFPLRAAEIDESTGIDMSMHGEEAYVHAWGSAAR